MSFFSDIFGSKDKTATTSSLDPREIESPFGSISGGANAPLQIDPSQGLTDLFNSFMGIGQSGLDQFSAFDQQGFTQSALDKLRMLAAPSEANQAQSLVGGLFNRGILGRNVNQPSVAVPGMFGEVQPEIFQLQQLLADSDMRRQLAAIDLGNQESARLLGQGNAGVQGLFNTMTLPMNLAQMSLSSGNQSGTSNTTSTPSPFSVISGLFSGGLGGGIGSSIGAGLSSAGVGLGGFFPGQFGDVTIGPRQL